MGSYEKNSTETYVLEPILVGQKKFLFLIWGHFLVERVMFDVFNVKNRFYRRKGNFSTQFERLNGFFISAKRPE